MLHWSHFGSGLKMIGPGLVFVLVSMACPAAVNDGRPMQKSDLSGLNLKDPAADAARDISSNKRRCYSVNGLGNYFPGIVGLEDDAYCRRMEVNFSFTSDYITSRAQGVSNDQAIGYAESYNRYVVSHK